MCMALVYRIVLLVERGGLVEALYGVVVLVGFVFGVYFFDAGFC